MPHYTFFNEYFFCFTRRSQKTGSRQHAESKTLQVGSCARAVVVVDAVVLTFTRIIKSVVTGQSAVTLEWRNTPRKKKIPLFTAASCFCHSLSRIVLLLPRSQYVLSTKHSTFLALT